jgi:hypothetical protein
MAASDKWHVTGDERIQPGATEYPAEAQGRRGFSEVFPISPRLGVSAGEHWFVPLCGLGELGAKK